MDVTRSQQYKDWQREHERLQSKKVAYSENEEARTKRIDRARKDYRFFVKTYFPDIARCECADFQIDAANHVLNNRVTSDLYEWARGLAKSTHLGLLTPLWLKIQKTRQFYTLVYVSKSEDAAQQLLADMQAELAYNEQFIRDFGPQMKTGCWADGEFETNDGCYFVALGRGQSPRGLKNKSRRPDYIIVDDIDDDEMCRNPKRVNDATEWVLSALYGTMDAGRGRFVVVGNRIGKISVIAALAKNKTFYHTTVNILRPNGMPRWETNHTIEDINRIRETVGEINFQKEFMNNPILEGSVFAAKDITYGKILPLKQYKQLICYTDPSFKNSANADYKATALVGKTADGKIHLIKMYADQTSVSNMIGWHYEIMNYVNGRVPVLYFMEANFMQDLMIDEFRKVGDKIGQHVPIVGDKRSKGDKFARIETMQPLFSRHLVIFNEAEKDSQGMKILVEQMLMFQRGSRIHDDAPDAVESAIWMLMHRMRSSNNVITPLGTSHRRSW